MISKTRQFGFLAVLAAAIVGGTAMFADTPKAEAACSFKTCYVLALPDLVVTNILADNLGGGKTEMRFWVKNQGTAAASPFIHRMDIAGVGQWFVLSGVIPAGGVKKYTVTINTPGGSFAKPVQVCADATNSSFELNEQNNCLTKTIQFGVIDDVSGSR